MSTVGTWASTIPKTWQIMPLKAVADYNVSSVDKIPADGEIPIRLCNYTDVYKNEFISPDMELMKATATPAEIEKFGLKIGDVIITKDSETWDDIAIPALVRATSDDLVCGYHLAIIRTHTDQMDGEFLFRVLQSKDMRLPLELVSLGVTRFGLPKEEIGKLEIPVPPRALQTRIARYLSLELGQIDELIAAKERMLSLLGTQRAGKVRAAVFRGLTPQLRFRKSGHPWLGEVPAHWEIKRSKRLLVERDERSTTGEEEMLTVSHLTGITPRSQKDVNMFEAETNEGYKIVSPDNLVINTLWAWMGAMGVSKHEGIVSPAYHVYRISEQLLPAYVDALVRTPAFVAEITRFSKGVWSSRLRLYPEGLHEVWIPVPPLVEQRAIVAHLEAERQSTAEIEKALRDSIGLLQERRRALITAAVTGQIPVEAMSQ